MLVTLRLVTTLLARPPHAERAVHERVGVGRARVAQVEHVLPVGRPAVVHVQVPRKRPWLTLKPALKRLLAGALASRGSKPSITGSAWNE